MKVQQLLSIILTNMQSCGDCPAQPLTDQSQDLEDYQYPMLTITSNVFSNRKYNLVETAQSNQSFKAKLFNPTTFERQSNQQLYNELLRKRIQEQEQINQIKLKTNVYEKLNAEYQILKSRRNKLEEEHLNHQVKQCTFHPSIGDKSKRLGQHFGSSPRYMSPKQQPTPSQQQQVLASQITAQSATNKRKDKHSSAHNNKENVFDRLLRPTKPLIQQVQSAKISVKSSPERVEAITNRLYENAFQPRKFKLPREQPDNCQEPTSSREKYQLHHFVKEFYRAITQSRLWTLDHYEEIKPKVPFEFNITQDLCLLTIDELAITMDELGFIPFQIYDPKDKAGPIYKLFESLKCPSNFDMLLSRNLLCFLLAMQGFQVDYSLVPEYINTYDVKFPNKLQKGIFEFENGNLVITSCEAIQKSYNYLYVNYLAYKKSQVPIPEEAPQFKTSKTTKQLAQRFRARVQSQYLDSEKKKLHLQDYEKVYQNKKEKLQREINQDIEQQCPFKPRVNSTKGSPKYMFSVKRVYVRPEEEVPSFTPDLRKNRNNLLEIQPNCKKEVIQRMIKGRVNKQLKDLIIATGTCNQKKRKQLEQVIYQNQDYPILYLDIEMENWVRRIVVHRNDTAQGLAEFFVRQNELPIDMMPQLREIIQEQLDTL